MKGTLHKSMNYGWMVQDGVDSFYPLHPYDIYTNSIERIDGKEVDFILIHSWSSQEEKLIEVAIISANITEVTQKEGETTSSQTEHNLPKVENKDSFGEISDEEIEKGAKEWYNKEGAYSASAIVLKTWVYAIRWYREQLKQRQ